MSWIYENFGKPNRCEKCGTDRNVFWFSISGKLKEDRKDWFVSCNKCRKRMKDEIKGYEDSIKEVKLRREQAGKELSEIENKIINNNYNEIVKRKNETIKKNKTLEDINYKLCIEISKKETEINKLKIAFKKENKEINKKNKQQESKAERIANKIEKGKLEVKDNTNLIKTQREEIKEILKEVKKLSISKQAIKDKIKQLDKKLLEANKIISETGETMKLIESEKNAIDKREHKADVRERSLLRKYKRIGININNF